MWDILQPERRRHKVPIFFFPTFLLHYFLCIVQGKKWQTLKFEVAARMSPIICPNPAMHNPSFVSVLFFSFRSFFSILVSTFSFIYLFFFSFSFFYIMYECMTHISAC